VTWVAGDFGVRFSFLISHWQDIPYADFDGPALLLRSNGSTNSSNENRQGPVLAIENPLANGSKSRRSGERQGPNNALMAPLQNPPVVGDFIAAFS
jgi:hypothetical protein